MKLIFEKDYELNIKIYLNNENYNLYLYIDNEFITVFEFYLPTFKEDIINIFPDWIYDILKNTNEIINEIYTKLLYTQYSNIDTIYNTMLVYLAKDVCDFLHKEFKEFNKNYYCPTEFRFCLIGNTEQELLYNSLKSKGYYGRKDLTLTYNGNEYMVGCNFGD